MQPKKSVLESKNMSDFKKETVCFAVLRGFWSSECFLSLFAFLREFLVSLFFSFFVICAVQSSIAGKLATRRKGKTLKK